jgi:hypothetical protein
MKALDDAVSAIEYCYRMGWSDGLPIVPPTYRRVQEFLDYACLQPADVVLTEPISHRIITAEKAAANAVMAGCLPEYFPIVLAALTAMNEPRYNLHGSSLTSGGSAIMAVVNGPIVQKIGLNSGTALFCPGNRANSTIGRTLHLILWNCTGNRPDQMDRSIMGFPGRYSMCIAEREEILPHGWNPLHVDRGMSLESSTITVLPVFSPFQTGYAGSYAPKDLLTNIAASMKILEPWRREVWMVLSPEMLSHFGRAGWTKADVREFLFQEARLPKAEFRRNFKIGYPTPEDQARAEQLSDDDLLPILFRPESLQTVAGGGDGGPFAMIIPMYAGGAKSESVTKEIK